MANARFTALADAREDDCSAGACNFSLFECVEAHFPPLYLFHE
jgi:hypothetical protein